MKILMGREEGTTQHWFAWYPVWAHAGLGQHHMVWLERIWRVWQSGTLEEMVYRWVGYHWEYHLTKEGIP